MINLDQYGDSVALTASELADWLEVSVKSVYRLPIRTLPTGSRPRRYLARDVRRYLMGLPPIEGSPADAPDVPTRLLSLSGHGR